MKRWINCMIWFLGATHLPSLEAFGDNNGNFTRDEKMSIFNVVRNNNNIDLFTRGRSWQCCCCFDGCICCLGEIPQQCLCRHIRLQWNLLQVLIHLPYVIIITMWSSIILIPINILIAILQLKWMRGSRGNGQWDLCFLLWGLLCLQVSSIRKTQLYQIYII